MHFSFRNKSIRGLLAVVPEREISFVEEMSNFNFPVKRSLKLKEIMGYDKHRLVDGPVCVSDLAVHGMEFLFSQGMLERDGFDALILVTQSPDHFMPPTSNVIQGRLGLKEDLLCLDINQGCAGFLVGLLEGFALLEQPEIRRVVLVNGDVLSRKVSPKDRNSFPLIGDALSISILESSDEPSLVHANLKMDGTRRDALRIPAGGFRMPCSAETAVLAEDPEGNLRALDNLVMDGSAVFNFVQTEVPPMIEDLLRQGRTTIEEVDAFVFHQPNRFMLEKLADKLRIPYEKMPMNVVEHFGNSSGVTIPLAIGFNLRERALSGRLRCCFGGFGVGLTWASMLIDLGPMRFCQIIDYK